MSSKSRFKVGDAVFYPSAGVGMIEAEESIFLGAQNERCYVIRIHGSGLTIKVPCASVDRNGIRPLVDSKKVKQLYKVLSAVGGRRSTAGNPIERCKDIERKINTGSCFELGEVVRDLTQWKKQSGLSFDEARLLDTASNYLARELAVVEGIAQEIAIERIRQYIVTEQPQP